MAITDLLPWNRNEKRLPVRREQDSPLAVWDEMNRLMDEFRRNPFGLSQFGGFADALDAMGDFAPRVDVSETRDEIKVNAELPGIDPDDIDISLHENTLTLKGEKQAEKEEKGQRFYRVERSYGSFYRAIPLPAEVEEDRVEAVFRNGVLTVTLPKAAGAREKVKRITVNKT